MTHSNGGDYSPIEDSHDVRGNVITDARPYRGQLRIAVAEFPGGIKGQPHWQQWNGSAWRSVPTVIVRPAK